MPDLSTDRARCGPTSSVTSFAGMDEFSRLLSDAAGRAAHYRGHGRGRARSPVRSTRRLLAAAVRRAAAGGPVRARRSWSTGWSRPPSRAWSRTTGPRYFGFVIGGVVARVDRGRRADLRLGPERLHRRACRPRRARPRPAAGALGQGAARHPGDRVVRVRHRHPGGQHDRPGRRPAPRAGRGRLGRRPRRPERRARGCGSSRTPSGTRPSTGRCGCSGSATATSSSWTPTPTARSTSTRCGGCWPTGPAGPVIVCLQSGNVNTGACDDLRAACDAVHEVGGWVHVDGAFGLWASASPAYRHLNDGIELADSWSTDAHKWLNVPYDAAFALVSRPDVHSAATSYTAPYLMTSTGDPELGDLVLELVAPGARVHGLGGDPGARPVRRRRPRRPVLRAGAAVRRRARRRRARDRQRRGAQPGAGRLRRRRAHRPGDRRDPARRHLLDGRHHLARPPADADRGVELVDHRRTTWTGRSRRSCGSRPRRCREAGCEAPPREVADRLGAEDLAPFEQVLEVGVRQQHVHERLGHSALHQLFLEVGRFRVGSQHRLRGREHVAAGIQGCHEPASQVRPPDRQQRHPAQDVELEAVLRVAELPLLRHEGVEAQEIDEPLDLARVPRDVTDHVVDDGRDLGVVRLQPVPHDAADRFPDGFLVHVDRAGRQRVAARAHRLHRRGAAGQERLVGTHAVLELGFPFLGRRSCVVLLLRPGDLGPEQPPDHDLVEGPAG